MISLGYYERRLKFQTHELFSSVYMPLMIHYPDDLQCLPIYNSGSALNRIQHH